MRTFAAVLVAAVGSTWPSPGWAAEPTPIAPELVHPSGPPKPPPESLAPPRSTGNGLLALGSIGVITGAATAGAGGWMAWSIHGPHGTIALSLGAAAIVAGSVGIYYGHRRSRVYRDWREATGLSTAEWRRRNEPGRPSSKGLGLLGGGIASVGVGSILFGIGMARLSPLAGYEPRDYPGAEVLSITGAAGMVAGTTMVIVGSIRNHRYRRWQPSDNPLAVTPYPWASRTGLGMGLVGRF